ncbi:MAG: S41 family peptidase [Bacteroidota bacterium]|jgi:carboxyl-terminal processing protease
MPSKKIQVALPLLLSVVMIVGMFIGYQLRSKTGNAPLLSTGNQSSLPELIRLVREKYVDEVSADSIDQLVSNELLSHLDPHSVWMSATDLQDVEDEMNESFQGIGIEFQLLRDSVHVMFVIPGAPAAKAGILTGDVLLSINDTLLLSGQKRSPAGVRKALRGQPTPDLRLALLRNGKRIETKLTKGTVPLPAVDAAFLLQPGTGYIHMSKFANRTYEEFMQQMEKLKTKGMKQLVLDLRGNGGGLMQEAIDIADEFLSDDKLIVYTEGKHVPKTMYKAKRFGIFEEGGLVVLIDETSASASEVLAGALQDWDRATIIGRRSFGKGLVQQQFNLSSGNAVRLTTARYFTPLGRNIQRPYMDKDNPDQQLVPHASMKNIRYDNDTIQQRGKVYTTPAGKKLYGGGGIQPTMIVAWDTTALTPIIFEVLYKNTLNRYVYDLYLKSRSQLDTFTSATNVAAYLQPGAGFRSAIQAAAAADGIEMKNMTPAQETFLLHRCRMLMGRQRFHQQGFYEVAALYDPAIKTALQVLK